MKNFLLALCVIACALLTYCNWGVIKEKVTNFVDDIKDKTQQEELVPDDPTTPPTSTDGDSTYEDGAVTMTFNLNI